MTSQPSDLLQKSASEHTHLCPRQVLGVRMGLFGLTAMDLKAPVSTSTALIIIETGGCFADGIRAATGASVGHRTLRVEDLGKVAATFTNLKTSSSLRLAPRLDIRTRALAYAPQGKRRYFAQLQAYQVIPDDDLFMFQRVELLTPADRIISHQNGRVVCSRCGEKIINEREVVLEGKVLCCTCKQGEYYRLFKAG